MKKILALVLAVLFVVSLAACGESADATKDQQSVDSDFKMGAVLVGDENEGYTFAHIDGIKKAAAELGVAESQIIFKYTIPEDEKCYDACKDLAEQGCKLIITNSYGHQSYCQQAATEFPEIQFVSMTGDTAKASKLANFSNAFTNIYEARYVAGVVAGMKVKELADAGKITDANKKDGKVKLGYVGAYPYAEVVSGYTAYFLGVQSVYKDVVMEVQYTNSWFDITAEGEAANALLSDGCVIISQHADSTGAPSAVQAALEGGKVCYSVGYNVDMLSVAPDAALTSATNNWAAYYKEAIGAALKGEKVPTNWAKGYADDAVAITALGKSCAEGTQEKVDEVIAAIKAGTLHVFDTSKFTVGGKEVTSAFATDTDGDFTPDADEAVIDGYYHESDCELNQSAPSFSLRIDGITELNAG
ncbi:MAG: BMP family ABC transporter substrate-binding protein [Oscillospiraceae bacterium]|nr:BMP family ABC transporter substrate-binding protein [Candidatus Ruminococcus equi]